MLSTYELRMLAKLACKRTMEDEQRRRLVKMVKKQGVITIDEYRQFVIREQRPCHC